MLATECQSSSKGWSPPDSLQRSPQCWRFTTRWTVCGKSKVAVVQGNGRGHIIIYIFCCRLGTSYKVLTEMIPHLNSEPSFPVTFLHHLSTIIWKKLPSVLKSQIFSHFKTENAVLSVFILSFIFFLRAMTNFYLDFTFYMFTWVHVVGT